MSRDFYMRQLWDGKGSALVEMMDPKAMTLYAQLCGHALAKAHARSGDAIAIASYLGAGDSFDRALASFAEAYADQNERDLALSRRRVGGPVRRDVRSALLRDPPAEPQGIVGCEAILPATSASPSRKSVASETSAGGTKPYSSAINAASAAELSRISTRLSHCESTFSWTFAGRWLATSM